MGRDKRFDTTQDLRERQFGDKREVEQQRLTEQGLAREGRERLVAAFSVINREFIDALNLTDLMQAQNWATGSTFQSDIGTFNFTTFTVRYNSRGVSAGQQLRNFFPVNGDNDSYALERFDFGRGANSIVFGNGSLGGVRT